MKTVQQTSKLPVWKRIAPLMGAHFCSDFFGNVLPVILPLISVKFGLTKALVGLVSSVGTTTASLTQLFFGFISDRFSKANFVLWGPVLGGAMISLAGLMPNYPLLLLVVAIGGLGSAMFHPQGSATVGSLFHQRRGLALSLFITSGRTGASLAPIVAGFVFGTLGLTNGSFAFLGVVIVILLGLWFTVPAPPKQEKKDRLHLKEASQKLFLILCLVVCRHIVYASFLVYLIFLLQDRGWSYESASFGLFVFLFGNAFGSLIGGPLSDRMGRKPLIIGSYALAFVCLWFFLNTQGFEFFWLALGGIILVSNNPVLVAHAQEMMPAHAGTASAVAMGLGWFGGTITVPLIGILADQTNTLTALNVSVYGALLAAIIGFILPKEKAPQKLT